MEYLITYGWAVIVVGVVVLLLMSLRVFDVNWFSVRNEAFGLGSFSVPDFRVVPAGANMRLMFYLINNNRYQLNVTGIKIGENDIGLGPGAGDIRFTSNGTAIDFIPSPGGFAIGPGERVLVNGTTADITGDINTVFSAKIEMFFNTTSGNSHTETGLLRGRIEPP